jgi:hypothetical protein
MVPGQQTVLIELALLAACFMLASCLAYSSILKMEVICSSEMSDDFQRTTRHIPGGRTFHSYNRGHLNC